MVGPSDFAVVNHEWWDETTFADVGTLDADTVSELSNGMLSEIVDVRINRLVLESDVTIIIGPVLPHEVVGFSGGNKYLFPGLSGQELIDVTHWLGALITSRTIIGTRGITPVRALIDAAAGLVPRRAACVVRGGRPCHGRPPLAFLRRPRTGLGGSRGHRGGDPHRVSACSPSTACCRSCRHGTQTSGRGPRVSTRSNLSWPTGVRSCSTRPTSLKSLRCTPIRRGSAITHATSSWPTGTSTEITPAANSPIPRTSTERGPTTRCTESVNGCGSPSPRASPKDVVTRANLNYLDPASVDLAAWEADPDALVVPDAGEVLFRLR